MITSRRSTLIVGWGSFALTIALAVPALGVAAGNGPPQIPIRSALEVQAGLELVAMAFVLFLAFGAVGAIIVSNRSANAVGWSFVVIGPVGGAIVLAFTYGYRAIASEPGSLPAGPAAAWASDIAAPIILGLLLLMFLLFPERSLSDRAERRMALGALLAVGVTALGALLEPTLFDYAGRVPAPWAPSVPSAVPTTLLVIGYATLSLMYIVAVARLIGRLRRSVGRERDQLRLFVWAAAVSAALFTPSFVLPSIFVNLASAPLFLVAGIAMLLVPVSVGVAILRHRLLDIDLVIRRTVVVALLGAFITLVYIGIVVGVGTIAGDRTSPVLSAAAAALVALAFQPVRRRARRLADRVVFGERATPYEVMHEFAERVAGSYGTDDVLPRMATILGEGTGADRAQVWLRVGNELRPMAAWPRDARRSLPVPVVVGALPTVPDVTYAAPVVDGDEVLGALSVTKPPSDPVTISEERLLEDLAHQAALVLRNVRLVEDLRASRQRLVAAQDEERRRLERDIHDGAQQQLVALSVKVGLADRMVRGDPARAHELLADVQSETIETLEALRDLARGIYPPLLADRGLGPALEAQARKSIVPVRVEADGVERYPQEVEATVYFCVLEALQNAAKYAEASRVRVALRGSDGTMTFEVTDDGVGFDPATQEMGAGLQNMRDRLDAVRGSLEIRSAPRHGTAVRGRIPIE